MSLTNHSADSRLPGVGEIIDKMLKPLSRFSERPWWPVLALGVALVLVWATGFPNYLPKGPPEFLRALEWWLRHPFQAIPVEEFFGAIDPADGYASHCDKRTYRALLPLIHTVLPFGLPMARITGVVAGVALLAMVYAIVALGRKDALSGALFVWCLALSYAGGWPFIDWHYFGDGLAVALLAASLILRPVWLSATCIVLAGFTDERAVFAAPLVGLFKVWQETPPFAPGTRSPLAAPLSYVFGARAAILGVSAYLALRLGVVFFSESHSGSTQIGTITILLEHYYESYPARVFSVFEFLWALPVLFVLSALPFVEKHTAKGLLYAALMLFAALPALLVRDIDRSLFYLLPGILVATVFLPQGNRSVRRVLAVCLLGGLIWTPLNQFVFNKAAVNMVGRPQTMR